MHCSTTQELAGWLAENRLHGISLDDSGDGSLFFRGGEAFAVEFPWPSTTWKLRHYAQIAAMVDTEWENSFAEATLWLSLTNIWGDADKSGWRMVERMRASFGEARPLRTAPVHHFRDDEGWKRLRSSSQHLCTAGTLFISIAATTRSCMSAMMSGGA